AVMLVGLVKVGMSLVLMSLAAWALYAFRLTALGWALLPFAGNLVLFGWTLGLVAFAIIVRFGGRWQILAWSLPFAVMPVSCVFYPVSVLPPGLQAVARALPATHVFEACGPGAPGTPTRGTSLPGRACSTSPTSRSRPPSWRSRCASRWSAACSPSSAEGRLRGSRGCRGGGARSARRGR